MSAVGLAVLALATYRLTRLVTRDSITAPLRERVWRRFPPETTRVGYVLTCEWCASVWTASLLVVSSTMLTASRPVLLVLAVSGATGLLTAYEDR